MNTPFPSIKQFREVIKEYRLLGLTGDVELVGYPKIHGTNASLVFTSPTEVLAQGKNFIWTEESPDSYQFRDWMVANYDQLLQIGSQIKSAYGIDYPFEIAGEWAGQGIQKGSSVACVEKFFAAFVVAKPYTNDSGNNKLEFLAHSEYRLTFPNIRMFDIREFGEYNATLNVTTPELVQNKLVEITVGVENECPVAKYFGVDSDTGEGVVWHCANNPDRHLYFKVKGQKHSATKVKKLASISTEKLNSIMDFVEYALTENRMLQAVSETGPICKENISTYMKWIAGDIIKEESDTLKDNGLEYKDVAAKINAKALTWYKANEPF